MIGNYLKNVERQQKYKLIIFDMDGLMFDTERYYCEADERLCQEYGIPINIRALYDVIGTSLPIDESNLFPDESTRRLGMELVHRSYQDSLEEMCRNGVPLKAGLMELLERLTKAGTLSCVATSTQLDRTHRLLKTAGVDRYFAFVISGRELARGKPYPDIFLKACETAQVKTDEALVLEDSSYGGMAAMNASIDYIIIPDINEPDKEVAEHALFVGKSLFDVIDYLQI